MKYKILFVLIACLSGTVGYAIDKNSKTSARETASADIDARGITVERIGGDDNSQRWFDRTQHISCYVRTAPTAAISCVKVSDPQQ